MRQPAAIFEWRDGETDATGWVVWDSTINRVSGGGIFMHTEATVQETADIARNMTKKFTVTNPQIGGAKAGIRFNPRNPQAQGVLLRFIRDNYNLLRNGWVTAGDLNTSDEFIEATMKDLGIPSCQYVLGRRIAEVQGLEQDRCHRLSTINSTPACDFFPLIEAAVGRGVAESAGFVLNTEPVTDQASVLIQGFGAVGSSLAYYLHGQKIATVKAICDKDGWVSKKNGQPLPVVELLRLRQSLVQKLRAEKKSESFVLDHAKNIVNCLTDEDIDQLGLLVTKRDPSWTNEKFLIEFLSSFEADVFCPCAMRYVITEPVLDVLMDKTWANAKQRYLVPGCNNPYGQLGPDGKPIEKPELGYSLQERQIVAVPDWVANSGTAQLFHCGLLHDFGDDPDPERVLRACVQPITAFMQEGLLRGEGDPKLGLLQGCELLAQYRIEHPLPIPTLEQLSEMQNNPIRDAPYTNRGRSPYALAPAPNLPPTAERIKLVTKMMEEVVGDLEELFTVCPNPVAYDGFEPSGRMHLAQALMKRNIVNAMTEAGFTFLFWVADWFAFLNHKMGGDIEKIRGTGEYFIHVWRAAGMDMSRVKFLLCSDEFDARHKTYWARVMDISTAFSLNQIKKCTQIMGRKESQFMKLSSSQTLYPCMQMADINFLGVDACQLGLDQRKVNVHYREYAKKRELPQPVILSHHMLMSLRQTDGSAEAKKMSKSDPNSAIFVDDDPELVARKIRKAYCPEGVVQHNPCLDYMKWLIFASPHHKNGVDFIMSGGTRHYSTYELMEGDYITGIIHPMDLKDNLTRLLNVEMQPIRQYFKDNEEAAALSKQVEIWRAESS